MERFEIEKLRQLPIEAVAERLGIEVSHHKALCPFHADTHPSLNFSVRRNTYRCFVCDAHGGTIDLVMNYLHKDFVDACRWLASEHSLPLREQTIRRKEYTQIKPFDANRYCEIFRHPQLNEAARRFLYEERRLSEKVIEWCRLTSYTDKNGTSWLTIPYYNIDGQLTGIQNRNLTKGAEPRFRFPTGTRCTIYCLPVLQYVTPGDDVWICEGASDCWAMLSTGRKAIAIPSATLLTTADKELLKTLTSSKAIKWHMMPDADVAGERLFIQLNQLLPDLKRHPMPTGCKDYAEYYLLTKNQKPS